MGVARLLHLRQVERLPAGWRLAHRQRDVRRQYEVDLLVEDPILLGHGDGDEQHPEDVVAVALERRPRLVLDVRGA